MHPQKFYFFVSTKGSVTHQFCPRETSCGRFSADPPPPTPPPPFETSRTFFSSAEAPEALFILQALRLSVVYKSMNVHLGQGQDLIMSIQIYLKYEYTNENAVFCILCIDDSNVTDATPSPPNVHMTFLVDKIDM